MAKQPKWAMCGVCGGVIYAGPGINPIPRECDCGATIVIPLEIRGVVKWDQQKYDAAAVEAGQRAIQKFRMEKVEELGTKYSSLGFEGDELKAAVSEAMKEFAGQEQAIGEQATKAALREPDIEYTDEQLDPMATRVQVPEKSLDDVIAGQYEDLYKGRL